MYKNPIQEIASDIYATFVFQISGLLTQIAFFIN